MNWVIIGLGNGLSFAWQEAITWIDLGLIWIKMQILSNLSRIYIYIYINVFCKMDAIFMKVSNLCSEMMTYDIIRFICKFVW